MNKDNGGPAFPVVAASSLSHIRDGMSLRDYAALQAMAAFLSNPKIEEILRGSFLEGEMKGDTISRLSYDYADGMIAAKRASE